MSTTSEVYIRYGEASPLLLGTANGTGAPNVQLSDHMLPSMPSDPVTKRWALSGVREFEGDVLCELSFVASARACNALCERKERGTVVIDCNGNNIPITVIFESAEP